MILLIFLLPSLFALFVKELHFDSSFSQLGDCIPCFWSDGAISYYKGTISISIGPRSSLLIIANRKTKKRFYKQNAKFSIRKPDSVIFIVTEKEGNDHTPEEHAECLKEIKRKFIDEGILTSGGEISLFDVAILEIKQYLESYSFKMNILAPTNGTVTPSKSKENVVDVENMPIDNKSITSNELVSNASISLDGANQQDLYKSFYLSPQVKAYQSNIFFKGAQLKHPEYTEPLIFYLRYTKQSALVVSSLSGKIHNLNYSSLQPYSGVNRIPDDIRMIVVDSADFKQYYKSILRRSKVWYLRRDEGTFYSCIVRAFGAKSPRPTLVCDYLEGNVVRAAAWEDIFPIESTELILDLGIFKTKEPSIMIEKGSQFMYKNSSTPLFYHNRWGAGTLQLIDSENGSLRQLSLRVVTKLPENDPRRIPDRTKMTADRRFKIIFLQSSVWYHWKEGGVLIRGKVKTFSRSHPLPNIECINGQVFKNVKWEDIYPIESFELIEGVAPVWKRDNSTLLPLKRSLEKFSGGEINNNHQEKILAADCANDRINNQIYTPNSSMGTVGLQSYQVL